MRKQLISFAQEIKFCKYCKYHAQGGVTRTQLFAYALGNDVEAKGAPFPGRRITMGAPNLAGDAENSNNVTSTFFNTVHLLPKNLSFAHGAAKLASCPGRHLTSLRPCTQHTVKKGSKRYENAVELHN